LFHLFSNPNTVILDFPKEAVKEADIYMNAAGEKPGNCQTTGKDNKRMPIVNCAYFDEDYDDFLVNTKDSFSSEGNCVLSHSAVFRMGEGLVLTLLVHACVMVCERRLAIRNVLGLPDGCESRVKKPGGQLHVLKSVGFSLKGGRRTPQSLTEWQEQGQTL
jgi:hypothetical protein